MNKGVYAAMEPVGACRQRRACYPHTPICIRARIRVRTGRDRSTVAPLDSDGRGRGRASCGG